MFHYYRKELVRVALDKDLPFSEWTSELIIPWLEVLYTLL